MDNQTLGQDGDVQYIATQDFVRTLLSGLGELPPDILDLIDTHYDFMINPNVDEPGYQGTGHRAEQEFLLEYHQNRRALTPEMRRLEINNPTAGKSNREVPFALIAIALRRSPRGKSRIVLSDDPGLLELLQFYGVATMESEQFKDKLKHDKVVNRSIDQPLAPDMQQAKSPDSPALDGDLAPEPETNSMVKRRQQINLDRDL
jgi:hypothetical protein